MSRARKSRTYVDSGVLITAVAGVEPLRTRAIEALSQRGREYLCSEFSEFETIAPAQFAGKLEEVEKLRGYFARMRRARVSLRRLLEKAFEVASTEGVFRLDAFHVAAATRAGCAELITTELPQSRLHRARGIRVVYLGDAELQAGVARARARARRPRR